MLNKNTQKLRNCLSAKTINLFERCNQNLKSFSIKTAVYLQKAIHSKCFFYRYKFMKKLVLFFLLIFSAEAKSQDSLSHFNQKRNDINQTGMKVLGGWAIANIAIGSIGFYNTKGAARYFNQMNIFWNIVNLGIATTGFYGEKEALQKQFNPNQSLAEQRKTKRILLINAGLDLAYIGGGIYLNRRGISKSSDRLHGYGNAVILQGAFLFLFDGTMFAIQNQHQKSGKRFFNNVELGFNGKQLGVIYKIR